MGKKEATRIAVLVARFNSEITERLLEGAVEALQNAGVDKDLVDLLRVPGAFELPLAAQSAAATGRYRAIVALGAVIRGETSHFEYVCRAATDGLLRVSQDHGIPVGFGVLTCETPNQALARAGGEKGNKGADAVKAALEMAELLDTMGKSQ